MRQERSHDVREYESQHMLQSSQSLLWSPLIVSGWDDFLAISFPVLSLSSATTDGHSLIHMHLAPIMMELAHTCSTSTTSCS